MPTVEILGRLYKIRGAIPTDKMRAVARYVDRRMHRTGERAGTEETERVAVLTALNISYDYYETKKALEKRQGETAAQVRELVDILDDALDRTGHAMVAAETPESDSRGTEQSSLMRKTSQDHRSPPEVDNGASGA